MIKAFYNLLSNNWSLAMIDTGNPTALLMLRSPNSDAAIHVLTVHML